MVERKRLGQWLIEYDPEQTRKFYHGHSLITESCGCNSCKNYVEVCKSLPKEVLDFFDSLGIDPTKEGEVYEVNDNGDGTVLFGGFYHIVGKIIEGKDCWTKENEESNVLVRVGSFHFGFTHHLALIPRNFPEPVA